MGMLSVNTTGRDYSQYLYEGELRWQGPWPTPNIAAAFLATGTILLCGIGCALHQRLPSLFKWPVATLVFVTMSAGCFLLAKTYSRGGWLSMGAGILVLLLGIKRPRWYPVLLAALFALSIALHPAGVHRAASTTDVDGDKSISHRLLLWEGALQMMAEHPWTGVGSGKFGEVFMRDYQLPEHSQSYSTAINDFLTIGTERGIPVLSLTAALFLFLAGMGIWTGMKHSNPFLVGCGAAIFSCLVGSWFSSIAFSSDSTYLLISASIGVVTGAGWYQVLNWQKRADSFHRKAFSSFRRVSHIFAILTAGIGGICAIAGLVALRNRPVIEPMSMSGIAGIRTTPRWKQAKGTIFYLGNRGQKPSELIKNTLRPLAQMGWEVFAFEQAAYASDACLQMTRILHGLKQTRFVERNLHLAGHNQGAQVALALATTSNAKAVACFMPCRLSAFADISPDQRIKEMKAPLFLCSKQGDLHRSPRDFSDLSQPDSSSEPDINYITISGEFSQENRNWKVWIKAVDEWCRTKK